MNPYRLPSFNGRFGVARRDITPPTGIYARNWGLAEHDVASDIHQPLTLTALVISAHGGEPSFAIVALDLGWWRSVAEEEILARAVADAGFDPAQTLLALSHTHAGPSFCPHDADKPGGALIVPYLERVAGEITDALKSARASMVEGTLEVLAGTSPLAACRELAVDGRPVVGWNPDAPADQTLLFGRISDAAGRCLATIVNYACHPTIMAWQNRAISPDYVGTMRQLVEEETSAPCLFLQGASGDLAARHQYTGDLRVAEKAGRVLAHSVLALWHQMPLPNHELVFTGTVESGAPLGLWEQRPRSEAPARELQILPSRVSLPIADTLPSREALMRESAATTDRTLLERLARLKRRRDAVGDCATAPRPCVTARLGDIRLAAISDEAYSAMQRSLREETGTNPLFVVTLVNRNLGYLVPEALHSPEHYASRVTPYAPGSFELMQRHLKEQLRKIPSDGQRPA